MTTTSGPGMALKAETIGLAVSLELPLIVCDVQRAGPSTGMPTKTEQADLLMALYGRNGESPVAVLAPATPSDCFDTALEAVRIATKYRTPVIILSDGYLANGSEPWRIPEVADLPKLRDEFSFSSPGEWTRRRTASPTSGRSSGTRRRWPGRGPSRAPRAWSTGSAASRRPTAPARSPTTRTTTTRWSGCARRRSTASRADIGPLEVDDPDGHARVLVLGWGSTFGSIGAAVRRVRVAGGSVAQAHLRHLSPFPANLGDVLASLRQGAGPRDQPGPARAAAARALPRPT